MNHKLRILVAEDYEFNQLIIKQLLADVGVSVVVADNGQEALNELAIHQYDLILMDIEMPVMDGWEATRIIKSGSIEKNKETPIVGFTSHGDQAFIDELKKAGFSDVIHKPFNRSEIVNIITKYTTSPEKIEIEHPEMPLVKTRNTKVEYDLSNLRSFCDDDEVFVLKMLTYFISNSPGLIKGMMVDYDSGNWAGLKMTAHKYCSELGLLGITEMHEVSEKIEFMASREEENPELKANIDRLSVLADIVIKEIKSDYNIELS